MHAESNKFFFPGMSQVTQFQPEDIYTLQWFGQPNEPKKILSAEEEAEEAQEAAEVEGEEEAEEEAEEETEEEAEEAAEEAAEDGTVQKNEPVNTKTKGQDGQDRYEERQEGDDEKRGGDAGTDSTAQPGNIFNDNKYDDSVPPPTGGNMFSKVIAFDDTKPQTVDTGALTADMELHLAKNRLFNPMVKLKSVHEIFFNYHGSAADTIRFWQQIKVNKVEVKHLTLYKTDIMPIDFDTLRSLHSLSIYAQVHVSQRNDIMRENVRDQVYTALFNNKNLVEMFASHSTSHVLTTITKAIVGRNKFKLIVGKADDAKESLYYWHEEMIVKASSYEQDPIYLRLARSINANTVTVYVATAEAYETLNPFFMRHADFTTVNILRENDVIGQDDVIDTLELVHKKMVCSCYHAQPNWQYLKLQTIRDYTAPEKFKWIHDSIHGIVKKAESLVYFTVQFMKTSNLDQHKPLAAIATKLCRHSGYPSPGVRVNLEENSVTCIFADRLPVS